MTLLGSYLTVRILPIYFIMCFHDTVVSFLCFLASSRGLHKAFPFNEMLSRAVGQNQFYSEGNCIFNTLQENYSL